MKHQLFSGFSDSFSYAFILILFLLFEAVTLNFNHTSNCQLRSIRTKLFLIYFASFLTIIKGVIAFFICLMIDLH